MATDAASEGIDLQNHCHLMIHAEIPWNPNVLEQRNGRIDRHGQKAKEVLIWHPVGAGYRRKQFDADVAAGSLEGDLEFLMVAARKVEAIRTDLGKVGPVIASQVEQAMLGKRKQLDTARAERDAQAAARELPIERKLRERVARLHERLVETREVFHLSPANVRAAVQVALELARLPALEPVDHPGDTEGHGVSDAGIPGDLGPLHGGLRASAHRRPSTDHFRPRRRARPGRYRPGPPEPSSGPDVPAAAPRRGLGAGRRQAHASRDRARGPRFRVELTGSRRAVSPGRNGFQVDAAPRRAHCGRGTDPGWSLLSAEREPDRGAAVGLAAHAPERAMHSPRCEDLAEDRSAALAAAEARSSDRMKNLQNTLERRRDQEMDDITKVLRRTRNVHSTEAGRSRPGSAFPLDHRRARATAAQCRQPEGAARGNPEEIEKERALIASRYADPVARTFPVAVVFIVPESMARERS